jgi:hypothetical protein
MKNPRRFLKLVAQSAVFTVTLLLAANAHAGQAGITSYDVTNVPRSGFGCWSHDYTGTITNIGRTVSSSVVYTPDGNQLADYSGGLGTLADNVFPTSVLGTRLFYNGNTDDGQPVAPTITLHLDGNYLIQAVHIFGGDIGGNAIPGALDGVTVTIGSQSVTLSTIPFGPNNALGVPFDDAADLTGTPLSTIHGHHRPLRLHRQPPRLPLQSILNRRNRG